MASNGPRIMSIVLRHGLLIASLITMPSNNSKSTKKEKSSEECRR